MSARVTKQIKDLVDSDEIEIKSAVILLLSAHAELIDKQDEIMERLNEIAEQITGQTRSNAERIEALKERVKLLEKYRDDHPSLLWLARFRTKQTVMWILAAFVILSLWWVSDIRQPILEFFGISIF